MKQRIRSSGGAGFASFLWLVLALLGLSACAPANPGPKKEEGVPVGIMGYNYTIEGIQEFSVDGEWGGGISIGGGGKGVLCCVVLPPKWRPGLSAKVRWRRSDCGGSGPGNARCPIGGDVWHFKNLESTVAIEPYERPDRVMVVFLPQDEVKIYIMGSKADEEELDKLGDPRPLDHPEWRRPHE